MEQQVFKLSRHRFPALCNMVELRDGASVWVAFLARYISLLQTPSKSPVVSMNIFCYPIA